MNNLHMCRAWRWLASLVLAAAVTAEQVEKSLETSASNEPHVMLIVYGYEYARYRVPIFIRSALASRSSALHLHVVGDKPGLQGFHEMWQSHAISTSLVRSDDSLHLLPVEELPPRASSYLESLHPSCHARGYGYLFLKVLAGELLTGSERIIIIDSDSIVLGDLADLWREFDHFGEQHIVGMVVDQSDRYYYRLQNPEDDVYSVGWRGVPHGVGVNGGLLLLHAERARKVAFADALANLTHVGAAERAAGLLSAFCDLAEQDTLNLAIARRPQFWRPLPCSWNYMATELGGHAMVADDNVPLTFYDVCEAGVHGSRGAPGDLLRCVCGRRVGVLHFAGGVRARPLLGDLNATILGSSGESLVELARRRAARPVVHHVHLPASAVSVARAPPVMEESSSVRQPVDQGPRKEDNISSNVKDET